MATLDTEVTLVDDVPAVREALHNLEAHATGDRLPGLLESPGVSVDRLRAFASAAAAFFVARPWDHLATEDLVIVESAHAPRNMCHVSVLGQAGQQFGLAFFDSRRAFERLLDAADAGRSASRAHGVTFGTIDELPIADGDAWQDHALPVAAPHGYPLPADMKRGGVVRRPDARALTFSEALLRALAGAAAIGADRFASLRGEFWGHLETRPYMRARLGLAQALRDLGRDDEAVAHYRALLELNPRACDTSCSPPCCNAA